MTTADLSRQTVAVVSRDAWTLFNFRRALLRDLATRGVRAVALGAAGEAYEQRLREAHIEFEPVPVSRRGIDPLRDLRLIGVLAAKFRRLRPAVVHSFTIKPAIYATLAARLAGVPVRIVTITGLGHAFTSGASAVRRVVAFLYRVALAHADVVFFQNRDDLELFVNGGMVQADQARLVAGSGVNLEEFSPAPLPCAQGTVPRFVMIARLLREKGVHEYIEAARRVRQQRPEVHFTLVGGPDSRNPSSLSTAEIERLRLAGPIEWVGEVADVRPFIARSDVVVLPSHREGTPRSLLEAAAMGRAVITTDAVGCRNAVEPGVTGHSVPVGDVAALAGAMLELAASPDVVMRMGAAGRERVSRLFDERTVIQSTIDAYGEILFRKRSNATPTPVS